jgi:biotin carboxyl carrier protein
VTPVLLEAERLGVPERVILASAVGSFEPREPQTVTSEGEVVSEGQVIGDVHSSQGIVPVVSRFTGFLMGLLAHPGERVRPGQPVAWLRVFES